MLSLVERMDIVTLYVYNIAKETIIAVAETTDINHSHM